MSSGRDNTAGRPAVIAEKFLRGRIGRGHPCRFAGDPPPPPLHLVMDNGQNTGTLINSDILASPKAAYVQSASSSLTFFGAFTDPNDA